MLQGWVQIAIYVVILIALVKPVGIYMARVFTNERVFLSPLVGPLERLFYRLLRIRPDEEGQDWKALRAQPDRLLPVLLAGALL